MCLVIIGEHCYIYICRVSYRIFCWGGGGGGGERRWRETFRASPHSVGYIWTCVWAKLDHSHFMSWKTGWLYGST